MENNVWGKKGKLPALEKCKKNLPHELEEKKLIQQQNKNLNLPTVKEKQRTVQLSGQITESQFIMDCWDTCMHIKIYQTTD